MPPRHAYWTIIVDNQPTAFRAHDAEELEPTLNRLKEKHPTAVMRWFERGKLWESRDAARAEGFGRGERRWEGPRPERPVDSGPGFSREGRGGDEEKPRDRKWRPGGDHRDPRQKYKDAKKAKWDRFKKTIRQRTDRKRGPGTGPNDPRQFTLPHGDPFRDQIDESKGSKPPRDRPPDRRDRPSGDWRDRPQGNQPPKGDWRSRPPSDRRHGDRREQPMADRRDRPTGDWRDRPKGDWRDQPKGDWQGRTRGDWRDRTKADWRDRPQGERRESPKGDWKDRSQGDRRERPQGDRRERPKGEWREQPKSNWSDRPKKSWQDRPPVTGRGPKDRNRAPRGEGRKPWGAKSQSQGKPKGAKPFGGRGPGGPRRQGASRGPRKRRDDE